MKLRHILSPLLALTLAGCMSTQREIPEPDFPSVESTAGTSAEPAQPTGESPGTAESTPGAESGESDPTTESTPTTEPQDAAHRILAGMSPEEKAGQLVLARYPGASIAAEVLEEYPHIKLERRSVPRISAESGGKGDGFAAIRGIFARR